MSQNTITTKTRQVTPRVSVIDISGSLTATAENALSDAYAEASGKETRAIVLNFRDLDYLNSSGIGLLVTFLIRANRQKQRLLAFGLSEHYRHIFELTRLNEAIGIYETEIDAITAANAV